jgi:hypothetical protein
MSRAQRNGWSEAVIEALRPIPCRLLPPLTFPRPRTPGYRLFAFVQEFRNSPRHIGCPSIELMAVIAVSPLRSDAALKDHRTLTKIFDTSDVRPEDQFAFWRDAICAEQIEMRAERTGRGPFRGRIELKEISNASVAMVSFSEQKLFREKSISRDHRMSFSVCTSYWAVWPASAILRARKPF